MMQFHEAEFRAVSLFFVIRWLEEPFMGCVCIRRSIWLYIDAETKVQGITTTALKGHQTVALDVSEWSLCSRKFLCAVVVSHRGATTRKSDRFIVNLGSLQWMTEDDERSACRRNQECSICFSPIVYVHKKFLLHRWCTLVHSVKHSSHNRL